MYDTIIIGAGPAGLGASVYAKRAGLNACLIDESPFHGGQVLTTYEVDNYLGLPGVSGMELSQKFSEHVKASGIEEIAATVESLETSGDIWHVNTSSGVFDTKTVIVTTGATHAHLNIKGEDALRGSGVSYCATCDGAFFKNRDVCVIGGSDVAVEDAIYLARTCRHVYLIHRRDRLRAADSLVKSLEKCENVSFIWNSEAVSFNGKFDLESVTVKNNKTNEIKDLNVEGAFIAVGIVPGTGILSGLVTVDANGYVPASEDCRTEKRGLYVAGDIRKKPLRQIITAVADGANAVASVQEDLR